MSLYGASGKESASQCGKCKRRGLDPWVRKIPWRRKWQPTPAFFPGKSHEQRFFMGKILTDKPGGLQSHGGHRESDMTEQLTTHQP